MAVDPQYAIPQFPDGTPALGLWADCATSGCGAKACTWADHPKLCFPCNEVIVGAARMRVRWDETHDEPMENT